METSVESILRKHLVCKKITLYRVTIKTNVKRKIITTVSYFSRKPIDNGINMNIFPMKGDILDLRVVGENDYDSQELIVLTVRPFRTKTSTEIVISSMTEIFEIQN